MAATKELLAFTFGLVLLLALTATGEGLDTHWQSDADKAWRTAQKQRRPLILYATMDACVYCRKMEKDTFSNNAVATDIKTKFVAANISAESRADLISKFRVKAFPTTIIISPDGEVVDYIRGYVGPEKMRQHLNLVTTRR